MKSLKYLFDLLTYVCRLEFTKYNIKEILLFLLNKPLNCVLMSNFSSSSKQFSRSFTSLRIQN